MLDLTSIMNIDINLTDKILKYGNTSKLSVSHLPSNPIFIIKLH